MVFIDETWIKTNMAPLRGWAPALTVLQPGDIVVVDNLGSHKSAEQRRRGQTLVSAICLVLLLGQSKLLSNG
ncbi:hypothetical protein NB311A_09009 [Nitrobacter sp. Nb-311A]|nr:hypothetical protein NB311A_09009 [Nitrobacter sp. Nb-311A]